MSSRAAGATLLLVVAVLVTSVDPMLLIEFILVPILVGLLVAEFDREGGWLAVRIVSLSTLLLPKASRQEHEDEWVDHVLSAGEHGLRPLFPALGIALFAAPYLALTERRPIATGGDHLERFLQGIQRLREVKASPPARYLDDIGEIQLLRMSDTEIVELQHAIRVARRRGHRIPESLIWAMASSKMSYRMHAMRGRMVRRRHVILRLVARAKYYWLKLRAGWGERATRSGLKR